MAKGELKTGDGAPDFTLPDQNGNKVKLSSFKGKKNIVLYFYPKDMTPGCTVEACSFSDDAAKFAKKDAVILGVSFDDAASHQKFIAKHGLKFNLLSDLDRVGGGFKSPVLSHHRTYGSVYGGSSSE